VEGVDDAPLSGEESAEAAEAAAEHGLAEDVLRRFVQLLLFARRGDGTWPEDSKLTSFHVVLPSGDDEQWWVRINDEPHYWTAPRVVRDFGPDEHIGPEDLHVEPVAAPPVEAERFISGVWNGQTWDITLKLDRPDPSRAIHLDAGLEFAAVADACLERGQLRGFHENAFHAVEHLVKAELLSYAAAIPEVADSKTHGRLRGTYQLWAHLENTEQRFARLLDELEQRRPAITYCVGDDARDESVAQKQQVVLRDLADWVQRVVAGDGRREIRLYATQDISAGQMVSRDTTSIRPPRR
jgi:hypothetical protein